MALVTVMSLLRHIGGGIQGSFYGVYLCEIGISATMIGLFISSMGLRVTLNQIVWFMVPIIIGFLAEMVGIPASFYICGGFAFVLVVLSGIWAYRVNAFGRD